VTELMARPLLAAFYPELGDIRQPLAGEFAARRDLLEQMAFCTGYAVEIGLLLDVYSAIGINAIAH
jgi:glucosyl-3-phosphoglycerate synthase